uniref:Uncharacterized protein n=1 Tax=Rousettus aegyptiacus TaxID=9407 RepID=A0A7J8E8J8_ROUAE|nr:hypothetical protein HJG63_008147 [Rousettus aegyptiacus]
MNPQRPISRHSIIKMSKVKCKERILKAAREKQLVTYKEASMRLPADSATSTLQIRRNWLKIFKMMKTQDLQPRLLYSVKLSFNIEGQIKSFPDKKMLKEFIITKPLLQEMFEALFKEKKYIYE